MTSAKWKEFRADLDSNTNVVVAASPEPCPICGWEQEHTHAGSEVSDEQLFLDTLAEYWELRQTDEGRALLLSVYGFPLWEVFDQEKEAEFVCTSLRLFMEGTKE